MGRPRNFDEGAVLDAAAEVFTRSGYEGTSIDDLVQALNLHRGSLYKAFGSKRGLFVAALARHVRVHLAGAGARGRGRGRELVEGRALDLLLVAALERGPRDPEVALLVRQALSGLAGSLPAAEDDADPDRLSEAFTLLGARLCQRMHVDSASIPRSPTVPKET